MKKVIYVAGPFRAPTVWGMVQNIRRAEELSLAVWRLGAVPICPHLNTEHFQGELPDQVWLEGDLEIMARCDAVIMVTGWPKSPGSLAERAEAKQLGIPVFEGSEGCSPIMELDLWLVAQSYKELVEDSRKRTGPMPWIEPGTGRPLC